MILAAILLTLAFAGPASAQLTTLGVGSSQGGGGGGGGGNDLLLSDDSSFLLLSDGSSKLCLASGC